VVIADSSKPVASLHPPVPLELHHFGLRATLRELGSVTVRDAERSPDGGVLADYHGAVDDPERSRSDWRPHPASVLTASSRPNGERHHRRHR